MLLGWATQAQQLARKDSSMLYYSAAIVAGSIDLAEDVILDPQAVCTDHGVRAAPCVRVRAMKGCCPQ